jgi:hypothetical protein
MKLLTIKRSALIALIAGTVAVGSITSNTVAGAQTSAAFRVQAGDAQFDFQTAPSWVPVQGTRVYTVRDDQRPNQDFFRYNNRYYVQNNGRWYRANRWNGRYTSVNQRSLPSQFRQVPQERWRAYPAGWQGRRNR